MTTNMVSTILTKTTKAPSNRIRVRVLFVEFVAVLAMSLLFVGFGSGYSSGRTHANASLQVHLSSDGFQMIRVDAAPHSAEMVEIQAHRNGSLDRDVHDSVSKFWTEHAIFALDGYSAVTKLVDSSEPQPASGVWLDGYQGHEPRQNRFNGFGHEEILATHRVSRNSTFDWQRQAI